MTTEFEDTNTTGNNEVPAENTNIESTETITQDVGNTEKDTQESEAPTADKPSAKKKAAKKKVAKKEKTAEKDWFDRLKDEKADLDSKIVKLSKYLGNNPDNIKNRADNKLLKAQLAAMRQYSNVLKLRISKGR